MKQVTHLNEILVNHTSCGHSGHCDVSKIYKALSKQENKQPNKKN